MHAEFSFAHFEWSFFGIYCYFHNQNIRFVEQGAWKKKWHRDFCSMGLIYTRRFIARTVSVPIFQLLSCIKGIVSPFCRPPQIHQTLYET